MSITKKAYQAVTDLILDELAKGVVPWRRPWTRHCNAISGNPYRGINPAVLGTRPFASPYWLTYRQAKTFGGHVRKGEKSTPIVFWKIWRKTEEDDQGENVERRIPVLKLYRVFNVEQCELPEGVVLQIADQVTDTEPLKAARTIVDGMPSPPEILHRGDRACYVPRARSGPHAGSPRVRRLGTLLRNALP
ncbi:MAG: ArdC-like ssDNA-binding domain-containing protein [Acidobacteriota bacterium]